MRNINIKTLLHLATIFLLLLCVHKLHAQLQVNKPVDFTTDGAWCWFQDPRSVYIKGEHERVYAQWMTSKGQLQVGAYDLQTGEKQSFTLKENWDIDDHNVGAFLVLEDKRIMIFYARHNKEGIYCRTTSRPENIMQWNKEVVISQENRITYAHPVYLSAEKMFYVFWRGPSWKPTFATSKNGKKWSTPQILIQDEGKEGQQVRPYTKITSDGISSIHIAFTDGHPNREPHNSVYYMKYEDGSYLKADGRLIGGLNSLPIQHTASDVIYDAQSGEARAWVWDIQLLEDGLPALAYARFPNESDHRYHLAKWDGTDWKQMALTSSGSWFPQTPKGEQERETYYSGGISIDPSNPTTLYLSRHAKGQFELEQWKSPDQGQTWKSTLLTSNSDNLNVRPVEPAGLPEGMEIVLWMSGEYQHYTKYDTSIKMIILTK